MYVSKEELLNMMESDKDFLIMSLLEKLHLYTRFIFEAEQADAFGIKVLNVMAEEMDTDLPTLMETLELAQQSFDLLKQNI